MNSCEYCYRDDFKDVSRHYPHCSSKQNYERKRLQERMNNEHKRLQEQLLNEQKQKSDKREKLRKYLEQEKAKIREEERAKFREELALIQQSVAPSVVYNVTNNTHIDNRSINIINTNTQDMCKEIDGNFNMFLTSAINSMQLLKSNGVPTNEIPQRIIEMASQNEDPKCVQIATALRDNIYNIDSDVDDTKDENVAENGDDLIDADVIEKHANDNLNLLKSHLANQLNQLDQPVEQSTEQNDNCTKTTS